MTPHVHRTRVPRADDDSGWEKPEDVLVDVRNFLADDLRELGVELPACNPWDPSQAVLLAEAANMAAKWTDCYDLKVRAFANAARLQGVQSGWDLQGCFYLAAVGAGEISAHDPFDELEVELDRWGYYRRRGYIDGWRPWDWRRGWSGVHRQHLALEALRRPAIRRALDWGTTERIRPQTVERVLRRLGVG